MGQTVILHELPKLFCFLISGRAGDTHGLGVGGTSSTEIQQNEVSVQEAARPGFARCRCAAPEAFSASRE